MEAFKKFLAKKDVVFTLHRYGIDALGAMAQGLFCTLLVGSTGADLLCAPRSLKHPLL